MSVKPHSPHAFRVRQSVPGVHRVIAVASGKGGVGKSTVAVNLALALSKIEKEGHLLRIGVLDGDIYGPSLVKMLNIQEKPEVTEEKKLIPVKAYNLSVMSIAMMVPEGAPTIWRGPMVQGALLQLLFDVAWNTAKEVVQDLDYLIIDLPPGTGDIHLTLAQQAMVDGAIIVSTPQDIALIDARKGLSMFQRVNIPILGIVENMSHFDCPHCATRLHPFGEAGARHQAHLSSVPFLGDIPLHMDIREGGDAGRPAVLDHPHIFKAYQSIAEKIQYAFHSSDA